LFQKCVSYHQTTSLASSFSYSISSVFNFENHNVRTILDENGENLFFAKDVCDVLGYANSRKAVSDHCKEKGVTKRDTLTNSGIQALNYINESNPMRLVVKSKLPAAEKFEAWVFEEVLPKIRKTGKYEAAITTPAHFTVVIRGKFSVKPLSTLNFLLWKVWKFIADDL
jgi:prophage antirepressor-like protein